MSRHRILEPIVPQPVKTQPVGTKAKNSRQSIGKPQTSSDRINTPAKLVDTPTVTLETTNSRQSTGELQPTADRVNTSSEVLDAPTVTPNGNTGTLAALRASVQQSRASMAQLVIHEPEEDWLDRMVRLYAHDIYGGALALELKQQLLPWQEGVLQDGSAILAKNPARYWCAIASGKGVGKTFLMAVQFVLHVVTHPDSQTCLTATSGRQTDTRVWKEVKRIVRSTRVSEYFKVDNTKLVHRTDDTWSGFTQPWNEERPESFQGLHAQYLAIFVDEASGVPDEILETIESGCTDEHTQLVYYSNPTRPDGRFKETFPGGKYHEGWKCYHIDANEVSIVTRQSIAKRLKDAQGDEDADSYRVNVRGEFPKALGEYFISEDMIKSAQERQYEIDHLNLYTPGNIHPYVMGCDISGGGMSASVAIIRQGPKLLEKHVYHGIDEPEFTRFIASIIGRYEKEGKKLHVFIEAVSYGRAAVSLLKDTGFKRITPVNPGTPYPPLAEFFNLRSEMAHNMRDWIIKDACLTKDEKWQNLYAQLTKIKAQYDSYGRLKMEDKQLMLRREGGLFDEADALATTFAQYVPSETRFRNNEPPPLPFSGTSQGWMV